MPTVVDSLVLEFSLDTSQFTREQRRLMDQINKMVEQTHRKASDFEDATKKIINVFTNLQRVGMTSIAGMLGIGAGQQVLQMVDHFSRLELQVDRLSKRMGMGRNEVLAWGKAFEAMGLNMQQGFATLDQITGQMQQFEQSGISGPLQQLAGRLGIKGEGAGGLYKKDETGKNIPKTAAEIMLDITTALDRMNIQGPARRGMLEQGGFSGDALDVMMSSAETIKQTIAKQAELVQVTDSQVAAAKAFVEASSKLETSFGNLGMIITVMITPALLSFATELTKIAKWLAKWMGIKEPEKEGEGAVPGEPGRTSTGKAVGGGAASGGGAEEEKWYQGDVMGKLATGLGAGAAHDWLDKHLTPQGKALIGFDQRAAYPWQGETLTGSGGAAGLPPGTPMPAGIQPSEQERVQHMMEMAKKYQMDPAVVLKIWNAEGRGVGPGGQSKFVDKSGKREESYGDFQLYLGGGKGNKYEAETGHSVRDPRYWKEQNEFAIREMKQGGLEPWHGWKGDPNAGGAGRPGPPPTTKPAQNLSFNIQQMNVNGENAREVASNLGQQLERTKIALMGNSAAV